MVEYGLGVDLGTTYTAAAVNVGGAVETVRLGGRRPEIPSVVFLRDDGEVVVGEAAQRRGEAEPTRLAREFKRRLGDPVPVVLGGTPLSAHALTARLLRHAIDAVTRAQEGPPARIVLTHPANWGPYKRELLQQAAQLADVPQVELRTEPEAAAVRYAGTARVAVGETIAIYDLGGGTFDAAVLRKTADGFEVLGEPQGVEQLGGIDFDEAILEHVRTTVGRPLALSDKDLADPAVTEALARLRRDCVEAKESLSFDTEVEIPVALPRLHTRVRLGRADFETMIGPALDDTVAAMRRALRSAGVEAEQLRCIVLAGGSARIPLVGSIVSAAFGRPVAVDEQPELGIALGAARLAGPAAPPDSAPRQSPPAMIAPPVRTTPPISVPPVVTRPSGSQPGLTPPVIGPRVVTPSLSGPPVVTPPVGGPPVGGPPVGGPPVGGPPVGGPPVGGPPVGGPPVGGPPVGGPRGGGRPVSGPPGLMPPAGAPPGVTQPVNGPPGVSMMGAAGSPVPGPPGFGMAPPAAGKGGAAARLRAYRLPIIGGIAAVLLAATAVTAAVAWPGRGGGGDDGDTPGGGPGGGPASQVPVAANTAALVWSAATGVAATEPPAVTADRVLVSGQDGVLRAFRREDGKLDWELELGDGARVAAKVPGGVAYASTKGGSVVAVDVASGSVLWRRETGGTIEGRPAVGDDRVFVSGSGAVLHAYQLGGNHRRWRAWPGVEIVSAPVVSGDVVVAAGDDGRLHGMNGTGGVLWKSPVGRITAGPVAAGDAVCVAVEDRSVRCLRAADGDTLARVDFPDAEPGRIAGWDGAVFVTTGDRAVGAWDTHGGGLRWRYQPAGGGAEAGFPAVLGDTVAVTYPSGGVLGIDAGLGTELWQYTANDRFAGPPGGDAAGVFAVGDGGTLYALRPPGGVTASPSPSPKATAAPRQAQTQTQRPQRNRTTDPTTRQPTTEPTTTPTEPPPTPTFEPTTRPTIGQDG